MGTTTNNFAEHQRNNNSHEEDESYLLRSSRKMDHWRSKQNLQKHCAKRTTYVRKDLRLENMGPILRRVFKFNTRRLNIRVDKFSLIRVDCLELRQANR